MTTEKQPASGRSPDESAGRLAHFTATDAHLVRQPVTAAELAGVRDFITSNAHQAGLTWLMSDDRVATVSVFHDQQPRAGHELVWYVETTAGAWTNPATELREHAAVFDQTGITDPDERAIASLDELIHVQNPQRPPTSSDSDVVLVTIDLHRTGASWLVRGLAELTDRIAGTWLGRRFEHSAAGIVEAERMWTETLWLDRKHDGSTLWWYMEADEMEHVMDAFEASDARVHQWSERITDYAFGQSVTSLGNPRDAMEESGRELLVHATNHGRR